MEVTMENFSDKISIDPKIMVGKPVIKGTRITVQQIVGLLGQGATYEDILKGYPHIIKEDICACLLFAQRALDATWCP